MGSCDLSMAAGVPSGFEPLEVGPGFVRLTGPMYLHAQLPVLAARMAPEHANLLQIAHGGYLATLADSALGAVIRRSIGRGVPLVTVNLNLDYVSPALPGDWIEAHVTVDGRLVLRASGIFMAPAVPPT